MTALDINMVAPRTKYVLYHRLCLMVKTILIDIVIKSPQYTGGDFMFLYRFVRRHFRQFSSWPWPRFFKVKYGICYISAKNGPIATKRKANIAIELWGSNVTSGFDLGHDLDLEFSRSNIEFAISQPKMVRLPRNEKQTYWLNSGAQMWPAGLTLAMTLTLNFQGQI